MAFSYHRLHNDDVEWRLEILDTKDRYFCIIMKTRLFKYIEKFTTKKGKFSGKFSDIFHIPAQNIDCRYSLEPPRWGGSKEYPQSIFFIKIRKIMFTPVNPSFVFFSPFSIAITSLGEKRANLSAFRTFVRFVLVWFCRFPLPLGVWEGLRFVIVVLPGLFFTPFFYCIEVGFKRVKIV